MVYYNVKFHDLHVTTIENTETRCSPNREELEGKKLGQDRLILVLKYKVAYRL